MPPDSVFILISNGLLVLAQLFTVVEAVTTPSGSVRSTAASVRNQPSSADRVMESTFAISLSM